MPKKYKINRVEITQRAQDRFDKMHENIQKYYSPKVANQFVNDFHDKVDQLKQNPAIYQFSDENKDTRRALFSKYGAFLYKIVQKTTLLITTFFDTRMKK